MPMPLRQSLRVGSYLMRQKLAGNKKFPLLVELEPLFACNLKCAGCGKIQQPHTILKQRMPVEQAIGAVEESGDFSPCRNTQAGGAVSRWFDVTVVPRRRTLECQRPCRPPLPH